MSTSFPRCTAAVATLALSAAGCTAGSAPAAAPGPSPLAIPGLESLAGEELRDADRGG